MPGTISRCLYYYCILSLQAIIVPHLVLGIINSRAASPRGCFGMTEHSMRFQQHLWEEALSKSAIWFCFIAERQVQNKVEHKLLLPPRVLTASKLRNITLLHLALVVVRIGCPMWMQKGTASRSRIKERVCMSRGAAVDDGGDRHRQGHPQCQWAPTPNRLINGRICCCQNNQTAQTTKTIIYMLHSNAYKGILLNEKSPMFAWDMIICLESRWIERNRDK